jgi:hypothetical protein
MQTKRSNLRKVDEVTVSVADEGNVPGRSSTAAVLFIALILAAGLALIHLASLYGPSHLPRPDQSSVR